MTLQIRALFLGIPSMLDPWYFDIARQADKRVAISLYNPRASLEKQMEAVQVIVDQGGKGGTREIIDLAASQGIKLYQVLGTGLDHTPVDYILEKGLPLANTPGAFSAIALAEHALMMMLMIAKNFHETQETFKRGAICEPMCDEIAGKTLGLVGFGASAQELGRRAWALGMRVVALDTRAFDAEFLATHGVEKCGAPEMLDELLQESDYVSVHTPLTAQTRGMIGARALGLMKPSAALINVARGEIVDTEALEAALRSGRLRAAGLDVFADEPIDPAHSLLTLKTVVATPHMAAVTRETSRRRAKAVVENLKRVARGEEPQFRVFSRTS